MRYTYKGIPTHKSPFDLALYQMLLWEQKPKTLIEIGSKWGGSALWFTDTLHTFGVDHTVHSIDIHPPFDKTFPRITFYQGDGADLGSALTPDFLATLARPLLVVEDADHRPATTLAVLRFFDPWLRPGEYIVVEDGIVNDLFDTNGLNMLDGGPRRAVAEFLGERGSDYELDLRFCDFYGLNVTWNVNGYIRRVQN